MTSPPGAEPQDGFGNNAPQPYGQPYGPPAPYYPPVPYYPPAYPPPQSTNGLAIASMVLGILWLYWIGSILAVILGFVARNQIKQRREAGDGMAIAGIVLGIVGVVTLVIVIIFVAAVAHSCNMNDTGC